MRVISFVGLGNMGQPIATHIVKNFGSTDRVKLFDLDPDKVAHFAPFSVELCTSLTESVEKCDFLILCVPDSKASTYIIEQCRDELKSGTIIMNLSSIDPQTAKELHHNTAKRNISYLDAPVTGGVAGAVRGTLTGMVGGDDEALSKAYSILSVFCKNITHVGEAGMGSLMKTVNNMIANINTISTIESLLIGIKGGLDVDSMLAVINSGPSRNYFTEVRFPEYVLSGSYNAGMQLGLVNKDLDIALNEAARLGLALPVSKVAREIWRLAINIHSTDDDTTRIIDAVSQTVTGKKWDETRGN
jgi:3-hydroxyisobutyrate dehydrogenase-like beta-hydroxyacid dehydrogenase